MADSTLTLLEQRKEDILKNLPASYIKEAWWTLAMQNILRDSKLQKCGRESILQALLQLAAMGLECDGQEATIIAYGTTATATPMYQGLIKRAVEAGVALHLYAELVYEGEAIRFVSGTNGRTIDHQPALMLQGSGKIIGAYAVALLPGNITDFELFRIKDIEAVKRAAAKIGGGLSPAWREWEGELIKKSALRRLLKRLKGKRNTDEGQRYTTTLETMRRVEPDPTPELTPEEMPRAAADPEIVEPEPVNPNQGGETSGKGAAAAAATPPLAGNGRTNHDNDSLVDDDLMKTIIDNQKTSGILPTDYIALLADYKVASDHQLLARQVPQFLKDMHAKAKAAGK